MNWLKKLLSVEEKKTPDKIAKETQVKPQGTRELLLSLSIASDESKHGNGMTLEETLKSIQSGYQYLLHKSMTANGSTLSIGNTNTHNHEIIRIGKDSFVYVTSRLDGKDEYEAQWD